MAKLYNLSKIWNTILKFVIVIIAYGFIAYQLLSDSQLIVALEYVEKLTYSTTGIVLIIMMVLNWTIEAYKWKYVVSKSESISLYTAIRATFAGVTTSIFMPFRTGEFVGKIFMLKKTTPLKAILMSMITSFSQLIITIFMGTISLLVLLYFSVIKDGFIADWIYIALMLLFLSILIVMIYAFFNIANIANFMYRYLNRKKWHKMAIYIRVLNRYSSKELRHLLALSLSRYIVFTSQYIILLHFFDINISYWMLFAIISVIYIIMTIIPNVALAEIGVRGSLAVILIIPILQVTGKYFAGAESNVIMAATILWIINLAIPAIIGALGVTGLRFLNK